MKISAVITYLIGLSLIATQAFADPQDHPVGKMQVFISRGDATLQVPGQPDQRLRQGMQFIGEGATIETGEGSVVYIISENGTGTNIGPNSTLHIKSYRQESTDEQGPAFQLANPDATESHTHLVLLRGEIAGDVKTFDGNYVLETVGSKTDVRGSTYHTSMDPGHNYDNFIQRTVSISHRGEGAQVLIIPNQDRLSIVQVVDNEGTVPESIRLSAADGGSFALPPGLQVTITGKGKLKIGPVDKEILANIFTRMAVPPINNPDNSIISPEI